MQATGGDHSGCRDVDFGASFSKAAIGYFGSPMGEAQLARVFGVRPAAAGDEAPPVAATSPHGGRQAAR